MEQPDFFAHVVVQIGPLAITDTLITTWGLMIGVYLLAVWLARALSFAPGRRQVVAEGIVLAIQSAVKQVVPQHYREVTPFIMALWIFLVIANLAGLIPGLHSPTRDLSATAALAMVVFFSVHWFGIRAQGFRAYFRHYLSPSPLLLPFHVISEISRTVALAVRLFGNMMSLEMVALLLLIIGGLLVPIPVLMLHIVEALVQAYIFGMLALVYIASTLQSQQLKKQEHTSKE